MPCFLSQVFEHLIIQKLFSAKLKNVNVLSIGFFSFNSQRGKK